MNSLNGHNGKDQTSSRPRAAVETEAEYNPDAIGNAPAPLPELSGNDAEWLAELFRVLVDANRFADANRIPKDWKTVWAEDFGKMLDLEGDNVEAILEYICYSQTPAQQKYFRRPAMLVDKHTTVLHSGVHKLKKSKAWEPIWQRFLNQPLLQPFVIGQPTNDEVSKEEIEFLDKNQGNDQI